MQGREVRFLGKDTPLAGLYWEGQGEPVLALHGWLDNAASFAPLAVELGRPLVALDFAGHGLSEHRPEGATLHYVDNVADALAVADELGWSRFTLMGHSMGAGVACLLAAAFPERVSRLLLIDGLGPLTTAAEEAAQTLRKSIEEQQALARKQKPVYREFEEAVTARCRGFGGLGKSASRLLCQRGLVEVDGGWTWRADPRLRTASALRMTEAQVEGFLRAIQAPTCLILADQGLGGQGWLDHRIEWLNNATVIRMAERHHLHMEAAKPVAQAIVHFLKQHSPG